MKIEIVFISADDTPHVYYGKDHNEIMTSFSCHNKGVWCIYANALMHALYQIYEKIPKKQQDKFKYMLKKYFGEV